MSKKINKTELIEMLKETKGYQFISVELNTSGTKNKSSRVTGETLADAFGIQAVIKHQKMTVGINYDYERSVNNQRLREGKAPTFTSLPSYTTHLAGSVLKHTTKDTHYLRVCGNTAGTPDVSYFDESGCRLSPDVVSRLHEWQQKSYKAKSQGLEKDRKPMNLIIDKITDIKIQGTEYHII